MSKDNNNNIVNIDTKYNITIYDIAKTFFPVLVFLSTYSLVFDFIQNREQLYEAPVTDTTVKDAQKKSLYISTIPTIIAAFIFSNPTGIILLLIIYLAKFFYSNS